MFTKLKRFLQGKPAVRAELPRRMYNGQRHIVYPDRLVVRIGKPIRRLA